MNTTHKPPLILVADDSSVARANISNILKTEGYEVIQAIDGGSAIKVINEHNVALAIIDHFMSPYGGFDFAKYVRMNNMKLPMIMVTNEETSDLLIETARHGIRRYLKKPADPKKLLQAVKMSLREFTQEETMWREGEKPATLSLTHTPEQLMNRAFELAERNVAMKSGGPFGAVLADKAGQIWGEGVNGITSRCDPIAHAEVMAIRQATEKLNRTSLEGYVLYCTSEPTAIGRALIHSVSVDTVYYGLSHAEVGNMRAKRDFVPPQTTFSKMEHQPITLLFEKWQSAKDRISD